MQQLSSFLTEIVEGGSSAELTATGNSMRPMLRDRVSRVRLAKPKTLKRGDIPLYQRDNGSYVLHRIVETDQETVTCCGDAQWHLERGIRKEQILAVVTDFTWNDRWVSCDCKWYRCYWKFWLLIRPLRHLIFGGWRRLCRIFEK